MRRILFGRMALPAALVCIGLACQSSKSYADQIRVDEEIVIQNVLGIAIGPPMIQGSVNICEFFPLQGSVIFCDAPKIVGGVYPALYSDVVEFMTDPVTGISHVTLVSDDEGPPRQTADTPNFQGMIGNLGPRTMAEGVAATRGWEPQPGQPGYGMFKTATGGVGIPTIVVDSDIDPAVLSFGHSVKFDSATSTLSFANDTLVDSTFPGDPIIGASVNAPTLLLSSLTSDTAIFSSSTNAFFTLSSGSDIFLKANLDSLTYYASQNVFDGALTNLSLAGVGPDSPFYDPGLANIDSPFLHSLDNMLNPASAGFDSQARFHVQYVPDANFLAATSGWTVSAESAITDWVFTADIPEPSSILLLAAGIVGLCILRGCAGYWKRR